MDPGSGISHWVLPLSPAALLLFLDKGTAEYVITQFTLQLVVVILVQWGKSKER